MPLVHQVVYRVLRRMPPNVLRDDLVAAGTYGLLDALGKSAKRGPAFDWYARIRIQGAVVDELRAQDWLTRRERKQENAMSLVGLDDLTLVDESASPYEQVERRMSRATLERAVKLLPDREANLVGWHYIDGITFREIASRLGVSQPRVSQLHTRALGRLREALWAHKTTPIEHRPTSEFEPVRVASL